MVSLLQRFSSNRSLLQSNANSESAKSLVHKKDKKSQEVSSHNSNENENSNPMKQKGSAADLKKGKNADVQEPTRAVEPSREELLGLLQKHTATLAHHQERFDNLKREVAKMQHELTTADLHEKGEGDATLEKLRAERWRAQKLLVQNKVAVAERLRDHEKRLRHWLLEEGKLKDALIAIQCMIERPLRLDESLRGKTVAGTDLRQILPSYIAPADPKLHMKHPLLDTMNSMDTDPLMSSDSDKQDEKFLSLWASMTNLNSSDIQRAEAPPELDAMRYVRSVTVAREALHARLTKRHAELEVEDRQLTERMQTLRKEALETINENRNQRIQKEEELLRTHSRECLKLTKQKQYLKQVTQERKFHMTRGMMQRKASSMSISPTRRSSPGRGRGSSGDYLPPFYRGNSETVDMMALESLIEDEKYRQSVTREQFEKLLEQKRAALDEESMLVGTLQKQKRELQSCLDELQRIATQGGVLSPVLEKNQMTPHSFRKNHANSRKPQNGGRGVNHVPHHGNSRSTTTSTVPTSFRGTAASKNSISLPGTAASVSAKQSSRAGSQKVQPGIAIATRTTTPGSCADSREMTKVITSSSSSTPIVRQTNRAGDGHIESNEKPIGRAPSVHQTVEVSSVNAIQQLPSPTSTTSDRREVSSAHEPPLPHKIDLANVQKEDSSYFPVDMDFPMMSPAASFLRSFYGARPQESQSNHPQSPTKGVAQSETETDSNFVEHPPPQTRMPDDITHTLSNNSVQCEGKKITGQEQDSALIHLCNLSLQSSTKVPTALMSDTVATNNDITTDASVTSLVFAEHPKFPTDQTDHSANKVNSDSSQIVQRTISAGLVSSDTICSQESEVNFKTFVGSDTNQTPKMNSSFRILGAGSTPSPEKLSTKTSSQERKQKSKSRHTSSSDRIHEKHPIALPLRSKKGF